MAYTTPAEPDAADVLSSLVPVTGSYSDTHSLMHARHLTGGIENVMSHGATANGTADDTAAFVSAINNIIARTPMNGGRLYIPAGLYVVDGDQILALIDGKEGWVIEGDGAGSTVLSAKAGSSCSFGVDGAVNFTFRAIGFSGTGKGLGVDAFRMYGNSRANLFTDCRFNQSTNGCHVLADPAASGENQNERNTFVNCHADNSTVGYRINSANGQEQLFIGGGSSSCDTAAHMSAGWGHFIGWFGGSGSAIGTCWKTDAGWIGTTLDNCLDEGFDLSFDCSAGPIVARRTYFQGATYTVKADSGAANLITEACVFNGGACALGASSMWWSRRDSIAGLHGSSGTYSPNATATRIAENSGATRIYKGTTEVGYHPSSTGEIRARGGVCTKVKAGSPTDADITASGEAAEDGFIIADTSGSRIWVRLGGTWKSVVVA